ncbi:bifunctional 2-C-methyl-D-erythritol 4-phosphate cytidylyltransferase/2-C-methyl-D-erythritol 2,4-cyclodiphosphate synthase [Kaistia dalseonensis]|uniref:Bifunctional enzyme IspD/IspF n=1 Tax=Kaistia dalseonensis TaxID=410840 RepID=A0ABU0H308_9HYPH|nr:bifunctional 2-C-methyl-D-erythritol 4-phosphate cytidylyltransferase/2-C-methyl-D-erythritol 2,4-cyclodiphosphate synthase [Kaistia dalseonensis]MCX5494105.1 bifunctional 2-C-methyl-D-erythritol 4-phosphate cytidylyltransferase/2-C-methyl-D-erythritol 2,4-cyclodiphosphate synthase [Kaistia dalseonensis]MDQ0436684.1 2-C-methyl-D-erythritol 4-phosphate cytidylyltransferase/2-C-methyl-D-erythritol 2,4-cyclodiphosphate synthase [Kaistia dalseonensis]
MPEFPPKSAIAALIVAAGRGIRAGGDIPKQYRKIGGKAILARTAELLAAHPGVEQVLIVVHPDDAPLYASDIGTLPGLLPPVLGGETRQQSVLRGLEALEAAGARYVLIHDAVRPFASPALIDRVIAALETHDAVLAASAVTDTLKSADSGAIVTGTVPREGLHAAETPQAFRLSTILDAHRRAAAASIPVTDDAAIAEWAGIPVHIVTGERTNIKLTTPEDIEHADRRLRQEALLVNGETRVGTGYDVHPFTEGDGVWLGGIKIAHDRKLAGHSDADVALHALTDAVLGAIADGDIGSHFPPSDPQWRGASSDRFLAHAVALVKARGGRIVHLDLAIVAEAPKIGPHRDAMRARIAEIAGIGIDRVGVKATTNEKMGFVGRGEGIAAIGTATIRLPFPEDA